jgi:hypothetical protein
MTASSPQNDRLEPREAAIDRAGVLPSQDWLTRNVETDPDADCEAGGPSVAGEAALFTDFYDPLRSDLTYLQAALSYYWGGPASDDVREAWDRTLVTLRDLSADYARVLNEKSKGGPQPPSLPRSC